MNHLICRMQNTGQKFSSEQASVPFLKPSLWELRMIDITTIISWDVWRAQCSIHCDITLFVHIGHLSWGRRLAWCSARNHAMLRFPPFERKCLRMQVVFDQYILAPWSTLPSVTCSFVSRRRRRRWVMPTKWRRLTRQSSLMSLTFVDLYSELSLPCNTTVLHQSSLQQYRSH